MTTSLRVRLAAAEQRLERARIAKDIPGMQVALTELMLIYQSYCGKLV
jgi:hypothetical protein